MDIISTASITTIKDDNRECTITTIIIMARRLISSNSISRRRRTMHITIPTTRPARRSPRHSSTWEDRGIISTIITSMDRDRSPLEVIDTTNTAISRGNRDRPTTISITR